MKEKFINIADAFYSWLDENNIAEDVDITEEHVKKFVNEYDPEILKMSNEEYIAFSLGLHSEDDLFIWAARVPKLTEEDVIKFVEKYGIEILKQVEQDCPELLNDNLLSKLFPEVLKGEKVVLTYSFFRKYKELCNIGTLFINEFKKGNIIDIIYEYTGDDDKVYETAVENGYRLSKDEEGIAFVEHLWDKDPLFIKEIEEGNVDIISQYTGENKKVFQLAIEKGFQLTPKILQMRHQGWHYGKDSNDLLIIASIEAGNTEIIPYYEGDNKGVFQLAIERGFRLTKEILEKHEHLGRTKNNQILFIKSIEENNFDVVPYISVVRYPTNNFTEWYYTSNTVEENAEVYNLAIEKGFRITKELIEKYDDLRYVDQYFIKAIEEDNLDVVPYYTGDNKENILLLAAEKGFKLTDDLIRNWYFDSKKFLHNDEIFVKSIENGSVVNILYYQGDNEEVYKLAAEKGFRVTEEILEKHPHFREVSVFFSKALEEGNVNIFSYYCGSDAKLIKKAIIDYDFSITEDILVKNPYIGDDVDLVDYIADINREWLKYMNTADDKIFSGVLAHILSKEEQDYLSNFSQYNLLQQYLNANLLPDIRGHLLSMVDVRFLTRFTENTSLSLETLLKTTLFSDELVEIIKIIKSGNLNDFYNIYNALKKYFNGEFAEKTFLKIAKNYNKNPNLCKRASIVELTEKEQEGLKFLFNNNQIVEINVIEDLEKINELSNKKLKEIIENSNITIDEIKDILCIYLCNYSIEEIKTIFEKDMRISILEKIIKNTKDEKLKESCIAMNILFTMLSECILSIRNMDDIRKVARLFLESSDKVVDIRNYFSSLKEIIRTIYEKEANESLLDFNNLPKGAEWKMTKDGVEYLSLEHCSYALYAHVDNNLENLFNLNLKGKPTVCLSPISNLGVKYYCKGITVLYNFIPSGNFVGSSNRNMGSNGVINYNNLDFSAVSRRFFQLPIKESSSLSIGHPETLSLRFGLLPCGIAIRGKEPSKKEIEAFEELKKLVPEGHKVYLVKPQKEGTVVALDENYYTSNSKIEEVNYNNKNYIIQHLTQLKSNLLDLNLELEEVHSIISMKGKLGGSHDFYECHLKGEKEPYYLKPGLRKDGRQVDPYRCYAMESGYLIQKMINPDSAIPVKVVEAPVGIDGENVLCSAIKVIPNTTNYDNLVVNLSEKEIEFFMKEFIVDHLLFSYDTKKENFLKDSNSKAYGIDKEQALKFATHSRFVKKVDGKYEFDTNLTYDFDPNGVGIIYKDIFKNYQKGKQYIPDRLFEECQEIATRISSMDDEVYLSNFINFINSYTEDEEKRELLKQSILARKNNLVLDYNNFVESIKSKKDEFVGGKQI